MTMKNSSRASRFQRFLGGFDGAHGIAFVAQHGLQRQAHVLLVIHDEHGWQRGAHLANFIKAFAGKIKNEFAPFSKLGFDAHGAAVKFDVVFDDGEAEAGAFFLGGVISLENPLDFVRRNARAVVAHGNFNRMIAVATGGDKNIALLAERFARVLQQVDEDFRQMAALHQQRRKTPA